jgi:hypothetical protein
MPRYEIITHQQHSIRVYRQRRRSLVMKSTPIGLVMFVPHRANLDGVQVRAFIDEALRTIGDRIAPANTPIMTTPTQLRRLTRDWAGRMNVEPTRISVRDMFRKWGSCSKTGGISLNTALCRVPRPLAEYVICHELAHLVEFNHGKNFKALMDQHMPDWREREASLQAWMIGGTLD